MDERDQRTIPADRTGPPPGFTFDAQAGDRSAGQAAPGAGASNGSVIVAIGAGSEVAVVDRAIGIARAQGRDLVIVDRGGEGLLGNAYYDDMRADDAYKPRPDQTFDASIARREGRNDLGAHLEAAMEAGVTAGGWFPTSAGIGGLRAAVERFDGTTLVMPGSVRRPSLGDRFQGRDARRARAARGGADRHRVAGGPGITRAWWRRIRCPAA